jgi:hypothetical protein
MWLKKNNSLVNKTLLCKMTGFDRVFSMVMKEAVYKKINELGISEDKKETNE